MMTKEFEDLKEALKKGSTTEARKEAAQAFKRYQAKGKKQSKPSLVSLGLDKKYPTQIEIKDIPGELERNPEFFELLREVVAEED
jgi:hypothetical protein